MNILDIYYRAFKEYRKETADSAACQKDRNAIAQSDSDRDKFETTKYLCHIEADWIKAIEEGLEFVEKAVREERQFIRTNGEVVPIEKVKRISKDSVEHLAKHSEMITHVPEEETDQLIPDKLYMTEKLSDYAVYENRFLYMMLCYLRDFIAFRLEKIETLRRTYVGDMAVSKTVSTKKRTLVIESKIYEKRTDNPFPIADENSAALVKRITDCQTLVSALLNTDLMQQVAKTPMIKPPIVKTNVLKMNNNFKRALALYDYVASYQGLGFSSEEVKQDLAPYSERLADELAESFNLTAFTAYKFGHDIESVLEPAYWREEKRRRAEEAEKLVARIKRLKKRALESNKTLEEYMLLLEERNRMLERDNEELVAIRLEVEKLSCRIDELTLEKKELGRRVAELETLVEEKEREIARLNQKYIDDMAAVKKEHEREIAALNEEHARETEAIRSDYEARIAEERLEFAQKMEETVAEYEEQAGILRGDIEALQNDLSETRAQSERQKRELEAQIQELSAAEERLVAEYGEKSRALEAKYAQEFEMQETVSRREMEKLQDETTFVRGQLDALRVKQGLLTPSADYASRERFLELQEEYASFEKFFKEQWKITKREIRKEVLWAKREKPKKQKNDPPSPPPAENSQAEPIERTENNGSPQDGANAE